MILSIVLIAVILVACAVTIYRFWNQVRDLEDINRELAADRDYLIARNRELSAQHPQKRTPKSIRAKP